jgi:integrase
MQRKGLSAKTIKNVHGLLSAAMKTASILGDREDNPCRVVALPQSTATDDDMRLLTHAEARLIIDGVPEHYRLLIRLLLATGMRWGEVTALKVSDLDLASETGPPGSAGRGAAAARVRRHPFSGRPRPGSPRGPSARRRHRRPAARPCDRSSAR